MTAKRLILLLILAFSTVATAAPAKKKYHFELTAVMPKPEVKGEVAKTAQERVEGQVKKAF